MAGYNITTTTSTPWRDIKNTPEGQKLLKQYGNARDAYNAYNANQKNASVAESAAQQQAVQKEKAIKASAGATATRGAANWSATDGSKQEYWKNLTNSITGATTGAVDAANDVAGAAGDALGALDKYSILATRNFATTSAKISDGINEASSSIAGGIAGISAGIEGEIQGWKAELNEALKPVSTSIGSTAMMVENIAKNPLGAPQLLAQGAVALLDKVSPSLANELEGAAKAINVENLANLPGQMMGSLRNLTMAADALLSVPFTIVSDIYNGLMDIMEEIANLIDSAVSAIFDLFFGPGGLLDSIVPISEIMSMLEAIGELASFVGGIASMAGGFNVVTNITGQITGAVSNISSMVQNPMQLAQSYIPGFGDAMGAVGQVTGTLRDPEQFLKGMLPDSITGQIDKISSIPGLGFVSNFGTSIGGTLDGLSQGVFTQALDNYAKQIPMLAPLMNQQSPQAGAVNAQEAHSDDFRQSEIRPEQQTTKGGHVALADTGPWKVFDENSV